MLHVTLKNATTKKLKLRVFGYSMSIQYIYIYTFTVKTYNNLKMTEMIVCIKCGLLLKVIN